MVSAKSKIIGIGLIFLPLKFDFYYTHGDSPLWCAKAFGGRFGVEEK
ncbi:MAG: hypothetical protein K2O14_14795 [Oscillospiraceae bacterium]|nr:hypothetical protein [Oscillospiraceae bacterium]